MSVRAEHLSYTYPKAKEPIIRDISFDVPDGKVTVIIGTNGVGKSTLLKSMLGIFKGGGETWFNDKNRREMSHSQLTSLVGYMTQENALLTSLSVLNVVLLGRLGTLNIKVQDEDIDKALSMLRLLHLEQFVDRPFYALSGGQRRMVDVAQTLVRDPKILIMDEPTANLDLVNEMQVLELVKAYTHRRGTATLLTLHDRKNMKKTLSLLLAVMMLMTVTVMLGQSLAFADETIEVTDMKGRTVTLPADIRRVIVTFNMEEYFAVAGDEVARSF